MTAYRQQALACAASLAVGPRRTRELRSFVPNASSILLRNVYGWFTRAAIRISLFSRFRQVQEKRG